MKNCRRLLAIGTVLVFSLAFSAVRPSWAIDEVGRIRQKCEEFFMSLTKNEYNLYVKGKKPQYARSHNDFSYLFKQKKVELLRERGASSSDPEESRAMDLLATALSHEAVRSYAAEDMDQMYDFMMTAKVTFDGETVKFGEVRRIIAAEDDRDRRRQIYIGFNKPLEPLKVFKAGVISKMEERLPEWGFESYLDMLSRVREIDLEALQSQIQNFLEATDAAYTAELSRLLEEHLEVELRRARGYDIPYVIRGSWLDGSLSGDRSESIVKNAFKDMDLKAEKAKVEIEQEAFCGESILPRVFPLRVPEEIKTCYSPIGGTCELASYLYMRGKAEYYASIDQPRYFELRRLGNAGFCEASGLLFQALMMDPHWLTKSAGLDAELAARVARQRRFVMLYEARRNCVATLFQIGVYSGAGEAESLYGDLLERYMKWDPILDKSRAALEMDDLESAHMVQGYFMAAQLKAVLEDKFGEEWFASPEAGAYLKGLWKSGQEMTAVSAAKELGYDGIAPSVLAGYFAELTAAE